MFKNKANHECKNSDLTIACKKSNHEQIKNKARDKFKTIIHKSTIHKNHECSRNVQEIERNHNSSKEMRTVNSPQESKP
jgi:hypothetical protein